MSFRAKREIYLKNQQILKYTDFSLSFVAFGITQFSLMLTNKH